jgi:hypothetical protein
MGREKKAVLKWWRNPHLLHFKDLQRPCLLFQGGSHEKDDHRRTKDTQQHQTHKDLMREHCDRGKRRAWPRKHKKSCQKKTAKSSGVPLFPASGWVLTIKERMKQKRCVLPNTGEIKRLASNQTRGSTVRDILQT